MILRQGSTIRTAFGNPNIHLKSALAVVVIVSLICFGGLKLNDSIREQAVSGIGLIPFSTEISEADGFIRWFERDMNYLSEIIGDKDSKARGIFGLGTMIRLNQEIHALEKEIDFLRANPSYSHESLGFYIYDTKSTGWLHVLYKAADVRRNLITSYLDNSILEEVNVNTLQDGTPLYEAAITDLPKMEEVVGTMEGMSLPPEILRDYRVYILPFSMGEISGLGSKGYMILGAPPVGCEVTENQTAFTIAHELGHHIHMTLLGSTYEENPKGWDEYMRIRGIPKWTAGGDVNSRAWFESTEETFAEDVRVLFGTGRAASVPHGTAYEDPRANRVMAEELKVFIRRSVYT